MELYQLALALICSFNLISYTVIIISMSHLIIQRRRTQNLRPKIHSEESRNLGNRNSIIRILHDSLSKRRVTTNNSSDQAQQSHPVDTQIQQAKQAYKNKDTKNALVLFKKLQKKYPRNSQISYYIGSCHLNQGKYEQAIMWFRACLSLDPQYNKNVYICLSICYKTQRMYRQAIEVLNTGCEKYSKFKDAYFYQGKIYLKIGQFQNAVSSFRKCIKIDPSAELPILLLAESLKATGQYQQALQKFDFLIRTSSKYEDRALVKKIGILIQIKRIKQASLELKKTAIKKIDSPELTFLKGVCQYQKQNYVDAATFLQLCLTSNIPQAYVIKSLKLLIQICIKEKDFFQAQHIINRSKFAASNESQLGLYYQLVEGINDLIKRRHTDCQKKLQSVYSYSSKQNSEGEKFLCDSCEPYYAFCLFTLQKYDKALEIYKKHTKKKQPERKLEHYNMLICEGVVYHTRGQFSKAEDKFRQAAKILETKVEPIFLICVNAIQQNRQCLSEEHVRNKTMFKLQKQFKTTEHLQTVSPLFLFYQSLVLLFEGKNANQIIEKAISLSEEEVSQYFFIQALSYSLNGETLRGLQSISKAIELDQNIPEFFKERSKYFYVLERYEEAVKDIMSIMQKSADEEAKLLLTFYYYMVSQYELSLQNLKQITQQCSEDKFKQFEIALNFRLSRYDKCGVAGIIVQKVMKNQKINPDLINFVMETHIKERQGYSQFTLYYFHLILASYYYYRKQHESCLQHLFGALEEIQVDSENEENYTSISDLMLNQIRFNIALTSLQKESQQEKEENQYVETRKYIEMFNSQIQDLEFVKGIQAILDLIYLRNYCKGGEDKIHKTLEFFNHVPKLSDSFPSSVIQMGKNICIETKFLVIYPQKLKFNICPQFDESFLFNFDFEKVESKLCPPWFKMFEGHLFFTDKIRNESIQISETDKNQTPSLIMAPSPVPANLRQKFKLDQAVQKKLQKLMKSRNKSEQKL